VVRNIILLFFKFGERHLRWVISSGPIQSLIVAIWVCAAMGIAGMAGNAGALGGGCCNRKRNAAGN